MNSVVCLASVAASAAIARPAGLPALQEDPIFAAISRYVETNQAYEMANAEWQEAREAFRDEFGAYLPDALSKEARIALMPIDPRFEHVLIRTHKEIDNGIGKVTGDVITALHRELDYQKAVYDERVRPKARISMSAYNARDEAVKALIHTKPTSHAGLVALLACVRDNEPLATVIADWEWYEDDTDESAEPTTTCLAIFVDTIAEAVGNLLRAA